MSECTGPDCPCHAVDPAKAETAEERIARSVASLSRGMAIATENLIPMLNRAGAAMQEAGRALGENAVVLQPFTASINLEGLKVPDDDPGARKGAPRSRTRKYAPCGGARKAAQRAARRRNRKQ